MNIDELVSSYSYKSYYWPEDGYFLAKCAEFPGLTGEGNEREDALKDLHNDVRKAIQDLIAKGETPPKPIMLGMST